MRDFRKNFFKLLDAQQFSEAVSLWDNLLSSIKPFSNNEIKNILYEAERLHSDGMKTFFQTALNNDLTPIELAYQHNKITIVEIIIEVHRPGANTYSYILVCAARNKHWNLCHLLMSRLEPGGKNPIILKNHYTALHFFAEAGQTDLAVRAIQLGAKMTAKTTQGFTPIRLTASNVGDDAEIITAVETAIAMIKMHRAGSDDKEQYGAALLNAAGEQQWDLCRLLIDQRASFRWFWTKKEKDSRNGNTALHFFAKEGQTALAIRSVQFGADITIKNKEGKTPEQLAIEEKHWPLVTFFASITQNISLYTPVFIEAAKAEAWDCCDVLLQRTEILQDLKNQPISEKEVTPLYYFAKYEQNALAANLILGDTVYSDEEAIDIFKLVKHLCAEKAFDQLYAFICGYRDAEDKVRKNLAEKIVLKMDSHAHAIYTAALKNTDENHDEKYKEVRAGKLYQDIDWALCGAIQQNSDVEANFLLENGANPLYGWIGAIAAGKTDVFDKLKTHTLEFVSVITSPVALFSQSRRQPLDCEASQQQTEALRITVNH